MNLILRFAIIYGVLAARGIGQRPATVTAPVDEPFSVSYQAGTYDVSSNFMGGTELIGLISHNGKMYAANGYTADVPNRDPSPGPQLLVLDSPHAKWRQEHAFSEKGRNGVLRFNRIAAIKPVTFNTDRNGRSLTAPASFIVVGLAGQYGSNGAVYVRNDRNNYWTETNIGGRTIRAIAVYRDPVTHVDGVFIGGGSNIAKVPMSIYRGTYDTQAKAIVWDKSPEFSGFGYRVMGFFEYAGHFFFGGRPSLFERSDGVAPTWKRIYTYDDKSLQPENSGLRGLTAMTHSPEPTETVLAAMEGTGVIYRITPHPMSPENVTVAPELDVKTMLIRHFGRPRPYLYVVVAYTNILSLKSPTSGQAISLIGLGVYHPLPDHPESAWYLARDADANYEIHEIQSLTGKPLIAAREIVVSPFPEDLHMVLYIGGYDTNSQPCHNTAWIFRVGLSTALARGSKLGPKEP